jgi:hypothetical protein
MTVAVSLLAGRRAGPTDELLPEMPWTEIRTPGSLRMMKRRQLIIAAFAIAAAASAGCASTTMKDVVVEKQRGGGTSKIYAVAADVAFDVSRDVLRSQGGDAIEEHRTEGFMLASSSANELTRGTYMGVWVAPDGEQTLVTVITKRKLPTNAVTTLTEDGFHDRFAQMLAGRQRIENARQENSATGAVRSVNNGL